MVSNVRIVWKYQPMPSSYTYSLLFICLIYNICDAKCQTTIVCVEFCGHDKSLEEQRKSKSLCWKQLGATEIFCTLVSTTMQQASAEGAKWSFVNIKWRSWSARYSSSLIVDLTNWASDVTCRLHTEIGHTIWRLWMKIHPETNFITNGHIIFVLCLIRLKL